MEITVKSTKVLKRGKNDYGDWALVKIITDKDIEYTTLHKEAETITLGMVIEIDQLSIEEDKDGKEKRSFKKFEVVSKPEVAPSPTQPNGMTPDMWREKDKAEQWSRECNTCFMGIGDLIRNKPIEGKKALDVYNAALDWAMAHLKTETKIIMVGDTHEGSIAKLKLAQKPPPPATPSTSEGSESKEGVMVFKNVGELYTACNKHFKIQKTDVDKELKNVRDLDLTNERGRGIAFAHIKAVFGGKPDEEGAAKEKGNVDQEVMFD